MGKPKGTKEKNTKNNNSNLLEIDRRTIFDFATSELSQDAVLICLLACEETREETIRFLLENGLKEENGVDDFNIVKYESLRKQDNYIDVFMEFKDGDEKRHALIIEDKTDSEMHDQQMIQYIHQVASQIDSKTGEAKYDFIHFVFLFQLLYMLF